MVLTNVSGSLISIISEIGETSNLAAIRGNIFLPIAEAPAIICVNLNCWWVANTNGVILSGKKPLKASFSAINTLDGPEHLLTSSATYTIKI